MEERFEEVLDEMSIIRKELGYPVMATPFSQLVGTQAVLNVVTGDRYSVVPDEVLLYVNGCYGDPVAPLDQNVLDKIMAGPKAKTYAEWEPPQPELPELRKKFGGNISDDELILRLLVPERDIDLMRSTPPRTVDYGLTSREMANIRKLISMVGGAARRCARGLSRPLVLFFTATAANCSRVSPCTSMYRTAVNA
ncbi:hypothetical protein [Nocardia vaccinii]|uniref:hypothetical protein n=1 Tax=Nocardia vaccinii TaxID=1822 RepID=UPI00082FEF2D|nr:hypothetical protein [Nocardia vaccinii]